MRKNVTFHKGASNTWLRQKQNQETCDNLLFTSKRLLFLCLSRVIKVSIIINTAVYVYNAEILNSIFLHMFLSCSFTYVFPDFYV